MARDLTAWADALAACADPDYPDSTPELGAALAAVLRAVAAEPWRRDLTAAVLAALAPLAPLFPEADDGS